MRRQWVVTAWAAAAVVAVAAGVGAVALAQGGTLGPPAEPVSEESVQAALEDAQASSSTSETSSPEGSASESPSVDPSSPAPTGQLDEVPDDSAEVGEEVFSVDGGTFLARCSGSRVELLWWVAAQGWQVSSVDPGPGEDAEIEFEGADEFEYEITCADGVPSSSLHGSGDDGDD
jgi:hypothetical protein